jgi:arylsulfatase A-like enzyme
VVERPVELVDHFPTLLALTAPEEEVPGLEGESLAPLLAGGGPGGEEAPPAFFEAGGGSPTTHWRGVQDERWKLVYHPAMPAGDDPGAPTFELYDLLADPLETRDVKDEHRSDARRLREILWGWMKGSDWIRRDRGFVEERSEETLKALEALGYI